MRSFALILCALLATVAGARAQSIAAKGTPPPLSRVIKTFDFDERARGNVEDTPFGWVKVEGPGLPRYIHGTFDIDVCSSGTSSFRFDLNGGSITYRYPAGRIPVMHDAAYRVSVMCRTTVLKHARARLTAYFCDVDNRPIDGTLRTSEPFANEPGDNDFHLLELDLTSDQPAAASIVVELSLLQPALLPDDHPGTSRLSVEDIKGSAWFDDLRIAQVPDILINTDRATNVFHPGEPVTIRVQLRDRIANDLTGELRITDADNKPVYQRTGTIDFGGGDPAKGQALHGSILLPSLPSGWYEARLTIRCRDQFIGEHAIRFVQLGDSMPTALPDERIGINATNLKPDIWPILPSMLDELSAGRVKLSAWSDTFAADSNGAAAFDRLLDQLKDRSIAITAVLSELPPEVRNLVGGDKWTDLLQVPVERWQPQLAYLVSRHATHITRWQLLNDDKAESFASSEKTRDVFDLVYGEFAKLIGTPDLAMPWPAWFEIGQNAPARVALDVPSEVLPDQIPLYINELKAQPQRNVSLSLHPIDRARYGRRMQMRDWALRIGYAFAGGAESIDLPLPMSTRQRRDGETTAEPDKLFIAQRVISAMLSNARYAGTVQLAPDVSAFLFDNNGKGVMLVWRRDQHFETPPTRVALTLGKRATLVDLDGNATPLERPATHDRRRPDDLDLVVGAMPIFITDIDASLMLLRASLALDNPLLESSSRSQGRVVSFTNAFDAPISGSIRLTGPQGWTIRSGTSNFSLNPGEKFDIPVTIEFPMNAPSGEKQIQADVRIEGRDDYRFNVPINAKLGLSDVGLQTFAIRNGGDVLVQQMITNYGNVPINYNAFISVPGLPRQERLIANLGAGKTTIRKYRIPVGDTVPLTKLRSGLREIEGKRMLNEEVEVN